ncbi:MAG: hypothetical protein H7Y03_14900 [Chitinophagaceae bacterium]|nr:hypothetical protein [Chitinophagaceae bacterium]
MSKPYSIMFPESKRGARPSLTLSVAPLQWHHNRAQQGPVITWDAPLQTGTNGFPFT